MKNKTKTNKVILGVISAVIILAIASYSVEWYYDSKTPAFLLETFDELESKKSTKDAIGTIVAHRYSYDDISFKTNDTTRITIVLTGLKGQLNYQGWYVKIASDWKLISDTLYIQ